MIGWSVTMHNRGQFVADEEEVFGSSYILIDLTENKKCVTHQKMTNSRTNYKFVSIRLIFFRSDSRTDKYAISKTEAKYLSRDEARCIDDDSVNVDQAMLSHCISNYIKERLGCTLPWTLDEVNKTGNLTYCHSYEHVS